MNTPAPSEAEQERIEATYCSLAPLRELEADVRGWKMQDLRGLLPALLVTACYGFAAAIRTADGLYQFLGLVVTMMMWIGYLNRIESKRINLVTASLRGLAHELHELRKKQA